MSILDQIDELGAKYDRPPVERPQAVEPPRPFFRRDLWPADEWDRMEAIWRGDEDHHLPDLEQVRDVPYRGRHA